LRARETVRRRVPLPSGGQLVFDVTEALTAVAVAALTIYDMCKAVDKEMRVCGIRLLEKKKE